MTEPIDPRPLTSPIEVIVRDPTSRVAASHAVGWEHAHSLLQITSALADAVAASEVFEAIVDRVAAVLGASSCGLWLCEGRALRLARQVGYSADAHAQLSEVLLDREPALPIIDSFRRAEPVWIPSQRALLALYPHLVVTATQGRAYRVSSLPLVADGNAIGVLALTLDEEREASESERSILLVVARFASQALERLRVLEAERRSRERADAIARRMTILGHASREFSKAHVAHDQRLRNIVREIGTLMDAATSIGLVMDDGLLHFVATYHPDAEADAMNRALCERFPLGAGEGVSGEVLRTGEPVLLPMADTTAIPARMSARYRELAARFPPYALMCAPLRVHGRTIGTISAARIRPDQTFDNNDLELLHGLADRAASAIENSRFHLDADAARRRAEQLYRFANAAVSAETLEQIFDAAMTAICEALEVKRASILLFDDHDIMRFRAWRGLSDAYRAAVDGHSPWKRDDSAPQPVLVSDCLNDPAWSDYQALFRSDAIGALAFIPLIAGGQLIGKFMVYYSERHTFTTTEIDVAHAIANYLASMVARFRTLAELEGTVRDNELFAGVLAHDLRNPLSAIVTAAQLMVIRQESAGEGTSKLVGHIMSSADRMTNMIAQLLDFTRARVGGGMEIRPCRTSLSEIAEAAITELDLVHQHRKVIVTADGDCHGIWDPDRLIQVISNLVANAYQHGDPSGVVTVTIDGRAADAVVLSVHNMGVIPPALLPELFEPFRGRDRGHGDRRGLGLGLYIVREIVRVHHGSVDVTTEAAAGTTFVVRLPRQRL